VPTLTFPVAEDHAVRGARKEPVKIAIAHNKGGVSKTTSTYMLGRDLSRELRVEMVDLDQTQYLTEAVAELSPKGDLTLSPRLWLRDGEPRTADVVLIDSEPARGHAARTALLLADYVLIPVPPEPFCLKGLVLMLGVIDEVRRDGHQGNPYLQILGVLPTMFDQRWPDHRVWHTEMVEVCRERQVPVFPPIPRRQSYTRLSVAGHDYRPVADAIRALVTGAHSNPSA
jgi:cellulose biosynthesis protein BcsQ